MTDEDIQDRRWQLLYRSEYSARYHRRRAAFLANSDTLLTLVTMIAGATAFGDLVAGSPGWLAKGGAALVTLLSLAQTLLKPGAAGIAHAQWLKRWNRLHTAATLDATPPLETISDWLAEQSSIEEECVAELRALVLDCEDAAARALNIPGRQHRIGRLQRLLIHFGTFQQDFPLIQHESLDSIRGPEPNQGLSPAVAREPATGALRP